MSDKNAATFRSASILAITTFSSRILGLVREQVRAILLGTSIGSDAFGIAFMIPNLLRKVVGEGGISAAFIPVFSDQLKGDRDQLWKFAQRFFYLMAFFLTLLVILFTAFTPFLIKNVFAPGFYENAEKFWLTVNLTRIMFVYILFIGLAALAQAILNSFERFFIPSMAPILLNIAVIFSALIFKDHFSNPAYAFSIGVIVGGILQLAIQLPSLKKMGMSFAPTVQFKDPQIKRVIKLLVPMLFGATIYEINIIISQLIASFLSAGTISSLQFSSRILELTLGIFVVSIATVILPRLSKEASNGELAEMVSTLNYAFKLVGFITIPATLGLIFLREDIVVTLFGYGAFDHASVLLTTSALLFHSFGLFFIAGTRITVPAFYALKNTKTPVLISFVAMISNITFCLLLAGPLGNGGIALANSISIFITFSLLIFFLRKDLSHLRPLTIFYQFRAYVFPTIILLAAVFILRQFITIDYHDSAFLRAGKMSLLILVPSAGYLLCSYVLKIEAFMELSHLIKKRISK